MYLMLAVLVLLLSIAHATFDEDLKGYIQKTIANGMPTSERISFAHRPPPDPGHEGLDHSVPPEIRSSYFFPDILFWDPLSRIPSLKGFLQCPRETCSGKNSLLRAVGWKDGKTTRNNPRRLYGLACPVILVSRIYRCQLNHHEIIAHDSEILKQILEIDLPPFILSHITGMTREQQFTIASYILSGLAFSNIENLLKQQLWNSLAERCKTFYVHFPHDGKLSPSNLEKDISNIWSAPSNDFIESVFLADFMDKEKLF